MDAPRKLRTPLGPGGVPPWRLADLSGFFRQPPWIAETCAHEGPLVPSRIARKRAREWLTKTRVMQTSSSRGPSWKLLQLVARNPSVLTVVSFNAVPVRSGNDNHDFGS